MVDKPATSETAARTEYVRDMLRRSIAVKQKLMADHCENVVRLADICIESIANGGKLLFCGNGGSAADAQHLAAELLVRLRPHVDRDGLPAIALAMDSSAMTACGNDYSYEVFYERMVKALGRKGDVLIGITTSGKSPNVIRALKAARERGITALGFLGGNGGPALAECDAALIVPDTETGRIQEGHITMGHALMELIEDGLLERGAIARS
ncbi:MAG TPA: D-sedoheptulose 7-phosphate isomerase [Rhizomicrobium sp.]|nr:D-sedoheptulose 7-phosphate isomerase [Rhizomicrobium sp.]